MIPVGCGVGVALQRPRGLRRGHRGPSDPQRSHDEEVAGGYPLPMVREKIDKCCVEMDKTIRLCTKIYDRGCSIDDAARTPSIVALLEANETALQAVEVLQSDMAFIAKFRKSKQGEPMTFALGKQVVSAASKAFLATQTPRPSPSRPPLSPFRPLPIARL